MAGQERSRERTRRKAGVRRKAPAEWKPRFHLHSEERREPRADFPNLSEGTVWVAASAPGYEVLAVDGLEGGKGKRLFLPVKKILDKHNINEKSICELGRRLGINDLRLFRFVIAMAADQSRKSENHALLDISMFSSQELGLADVDFELLSDADRLSGMLERVLRKINSRAVDIDNGRDANSVLARRLRVNKLLEALDEFGRHLPDFTITKCIRPQARPVDGQKRRIVEVLALAWPKLTGNIPRSWKAKTEKGGKSGSRFYEGARQVCELLGVKAPSDRIMAGWLAEMSRKNEPANAE